MDEEIWIEQALRGSIDAYAELVRTHQAAVRAFVGAYLRNSDEVDDQAQEVFLSAWKNLASYRSQVSTFRGWILGISRHKVLHHLRDEARRRARNGIHLQRTLSELRTASLAFSDRDQDRTEQELLSLNQCVEALPAKSREVVNSYYFKSMTAAEIGRKLRVSDNAIRILLSRIRTGLRHCVEQRLASQCHVSQGERV